MPSKNDKTATEKTTDDSQLKKYTHLPYLFRPAAAGANINIYTVYSANRKTPSPRPFFAELAGFDRNCLTPSPTAKLSETSPTV